MNAVGGSASGGRGRLARMWLQLEEAYRMRRIAMRSSETFVLGAITGGVIGWLWGRQIGEYVGERTRGVRARAADAFRAVDEGAGKVLDRGGEALRRADGFLQDTKEHVSEALRAGEETIRPASTPERA
jgi:gas vesicle protein